MATKMKVITPDNLGKTIALGALDPKKWDVKYDPDHFEFVEGKGFHLKDEVLKPLKDAGISSGALVGSNLELTKADGTKITVAMSDLVPAAKADKFLKAVSYDSANKKLVFKIGNDQTDAEDTVEVSVSDLLPVVVGAGLEGDGTSANPIKLKTPTNGVLKATTDGLAFDTDKLIELVDGTGEVSLGYIIPKASA
jgi:hypothetical protein